MVTVDADTDPYETNLLPELKDRVGVHKVPRNIREGDLAGWGTAKISRRIVTNEILDTLRQRNGGLERRNEILYKQLFFFCYADTAKMVTIGGLIYERDQAEITKKCNFEGFDFVRTNTRSDTAPYMIESPNLTYREIRHLNAQLPRGYGKRLTAPKVSLNDLKRYEKVYRYFPMFAETEI